MSRRRIKVNPALAIEAAFRQEVLGHRGISFGSQVVSSNEFRRMSPPPIFPLPPFDITAYYQVAKTDS